MYENYSYENLKFPFSLFHYLLQLLSTTEVKMARETCNRTIWKHEACSVSISTSSTSPARLLLRTLQWWKEKSVWKDVWSNANISLVCVYLWCELDVQCRVIGAQSSLFYFSNLLQNRWRWGWGEYEIFSNIYHVEKDAAYRACIGMAWQRRIISRLGKRLSMCTEMLSLL